MPMRAEGPGECHVVDRWDGGLSWMGHPDEDFRRTSHALVVDGDVWLVDPLDAAGLDDELAALGPVAGVVVLSEYHLRDATELAAAHDVAVHLPAHLRGLADRVDGPAEIHEDGIADTGFEALALTGRLWREAALYHPARRTLVVADVLTTADQIHGESGLAVTPYLQLWPPREALSDLAVDRVLVGHGTGVHADADEALAQALSTSRLDGLRAVVTNLPTLLKGAYVAMR